MNGNGMRARDSGVVIIAKNSGTVVGNRNNISF